MKAEDIVSEDLVDDFSEPQELNEAFNNKLGELYWGLQKRLGEWDLPGLVDYFDSSVDRIKREDGTVGLRVTLKFNQERFDRDLPLFSDF